MSQDSAWQGRQTRIRRTSSIARNPAREGFRASGLAALPQELPA